MQWNEGYVVDSEYTTEFVREQSPSHLSACCVLNGIEPVALDKPFTYLELGSGQGFTANMLAASNPQGRFYAVDFLEGHIAASRELAQRAQLDNVVFLQNSFAEIASGTVDLPMFDYITLHGVYSWVSAENRATIVALIGKLLKPGGIAYVSYNALPGWSSAAPLQRLALEYADAFSGDQTTLVEGVRGLIGRLTALGARYMSMADAGLKHRLFAWEHEKPAYLAHEYMNRCWQPFYHADVARELASLGLDFAGSADFRRAWPDELLMTEHVDLLDGIPDPAFRETLKDYLLNTSFRSDVFVRGARRLTDDRRNEWLGQMGLALTVSRPAVTLTGGQADGEDDGGLAAMLDALAERPRTLPELASWPGQSMDAVLRLAARLSFRDEGSLFFVGAHGADREPSRRLNRAVAHLSRLDDSRQALASPLLGVGLTSGLIQRLVYAQLADKGELQVDRLAHDIRQIMIAQDGEVRLEGRSCDSPQEEVAAIAEVVTAIQARRVPVWQRLGML